MVTTMAKHYSSDVWLLLGVFHSVPGRLSLSQGKLKFNLRGRGTLGRRSLHKLERMTGIKGLTRRLKQGNTVTIFHEPCSDIEQVSFPILYFSAGAHIVVHRQKFRLSFIRPNNTRPSGDLEGIAEIPEARRVGKTWKALFGPEELRSR